MIAMIVSIGGVGYLRPASGTWGSAAAFPIAYLLWLIGGPWAIAIATPLIYFLGVWAVRQHIANHESTDPKEVVIDEVAGQFLALWPVAFGAWSMNADPFRLWPGLVAAFLLFRIFDIWKPGPAGKADQRHDAVGVMLDDIWAGLFAGMTVVLLAAIAHGIMMV
ncbi:MAG: phosphatidylglycerophosphatase A [Deltaproteobacteria bacterium]